MSGIAGAGASSLGDSAIITSVVIMRPATEPAACSAVGGVRRTGAGFHNFVFIDTVQIGAVVLCVAMFIKFYQRVLRPLADSRVRGPVRVDAGANGGL